MTQSGKSRAAKSRSLPKGDVLAVDLHAVELSDDRRR